MNVLNCLFMKDYMILCIYCKRVQQNLAEFTIRCQEILSDGTNTYIIN